MYKVLKSYVAIDLAFFFLFMMLTLSIIGSNISEYPEFVVIRKGFRFTIEIFYLGVKKFKHIGNCFGQRLR